MDCPYCVVGRCSHFYALCILCLFFLCVCVRVQEVVDLNQPGVETKRTVLNVFGPMGHGGRYILDSLKVRSTYTRSHVVPSVSTTTACITGTLYSCAIVCTAAVQRHFVWPSQGTQCCALAESRALCVGWGSWVYGGV